MNINAEEWGMKQAWIFLLCTTVLLSMNGCGLDLTTEAIGRGVSTSSELGTTTTDENPICQLALGTLCLPTAVLATTTERHQIKSSMLSYIGQNSENVRKEIAAGSGEHLDALIEIMEIGYATSSFKIKLQANFDNIYPTETESPEDVVDRIYDLAYSWGGLIIDVK